MSVTTRTLAQTYQGADVGEQFTGFSLAALPVGSAQFVQLVLTLRRGACAEQPGEEGLSSLIGTLLGRGAGSLNREQFATEVDSRGADLEIFPARDNFSIELTVLPEDLRWGLELLARMLSEPRLEESEIAIARAEHQQQLAARADEQRLLLADSTRSAIFAPDHAYGRPILGTAASLESFTPETVRSFHQELCLGRAPMVLCAAGCFEVDQLKALTELIFRPLCQSRRSKPPSPTTSLLYRPNPPRILPVEFPFEQSRILIGIPSMPRSAPNYLEASFANEVFGGAFISRLTRAVRSKEGLAYSAGSRLWSAGQGGALFMGLQTDRSNISKALKTIRVSMHQLLTDGLPVKELAQFKEFALSSLPFDYDSLSSWCSRFLEHLLYGSVWQPDLRLAQIQERVSVDSVNLVLDELLRCEQATVCILGQSLPEGAEEAFFEAPGAADVSRYSVPALKPFPDPVVSDKPLASHQIVERNDQATLVRYQNGVHLLSLNRPELLSISLQVWTLTGSMDEPKGRSGMSHFLEHLMFRGTERFPDGEFDVILSQRGGLNNAFTSEDFTVYTDYVVMAGLEEALCLEADRFANLRIEEEIFTTEKDVILEERSLRVDSNPLGKLYEQLQYTAFKEHPYGWPVIGWRQELLDLQATDLEAHYLRARSSERLLVVLAGGCPTETAIELVGRTLGAELPQSQVEASPWPALSPNSAVPPVKSEFFQTEERSGYSYLVGCYRFPREGHPDYPAAELLSRVVGQGDSSRLHDRFVRETQRVLEVWLSYESQTRDHPLFHLGMATAEPMQAQELRQEVTEYLGTLADSLTQAELEKVKRGWIAETAFGSDDLEEWAVEIAARVMLVSWDDAFSLRSRMEAVTLEDLKRVCRLYLAPETAVFASLAAKAG